MDADEFAASVIEDHARLTRVVYLLCGDAQLAEECAQDALVRAWRRVDRGETIESLRAWCTTVAINECRSRLRRSQAEGRAFARLRRAAGSAPGGDRGSTGGSSWVDDHEPTVDPHGSSQVTDRVVAAVRTLPTRQREVVVLHYYLDHDVATTAGMLGISVGAAKNALFHARRALADALEPHLTAPAGGSAAPVGRADQRRPASRSTTEHEVSAGRPPPVARAPEESP